jgi:phage gp45-like
MRTSTTDAARRAYSNMARGTITNSGSGSGVQTLDLRLLKGETKSGVEDFAEPYGFTSNPHPGAAVMVGFLGGNRSHAAVIGKKDRRYRPKGLAVGESALYDDQKQTVKIGRDRIEVHSPDKEVLLKRGEDVTVLVADGKVVVDVQGTKIFVKPGRIDLYQEDAPLRMMTEGGPSSKIWGVL